MKFGEGACTRLTILAVCNKHSSHKHDKQLRVVYKGAVGCWSGLMQQAFTVVGGRPDLTNETDWTGQSSPAVCRFISISTLLEGEGGACLSLKACYTWLLKRQICEEWKKKKGKALEREDQTPPTFTPLHTWPITARSARLSVIRKAGWLFPHFLLSLMEQMNPYFNQ